MAVKKIKVSLKLGKYSVPGKIELARQIVQSMTSNSNFTTPFPALATITAATNALETAYNAAQNGGKQQTAIMREKELSLDVLLTQLGHYVENIANNVESIIRSAGIEVKKTPSPVGSLPQPADFSAAVGESEGSIQLRCRPVKAAKGYIWQQAADAIPTNANGWVQIGISTRAKLLVAGLESGRRYWFRVAAVGTAGQGPWSDPATRIAP